MHTYIEIYIPYIPTCLHILNEVSCIYTVQILNPKNEDNWEFSQNLKPHPHTLNSDP